ncbi:hypothetical protein [Escherichia coli]|uniref:hypothetical protein n=1 Tax=Escherichia coli TaxID=562 RepID=UPI0021C1EC96|nr:hypothetical protein [Escherichia coli]MCT8918757.1 hypothetical protein [Escherichia coli]HAW0505551.1 hypothetical protein [Escherichia coli]HAW4280152.1 hypothetical protein [Escherichia coli]HAW4293762.1 hypothetical protein [Escherichia coli]HBB9640804.1 hypothetical protein [Escherichia coli]
MSKTTTGMMKNQKDNLVAQKISRLKELVLLFWVDEDHKGANMISEACQTRMKNIKQAPWYDENIHKVHCPPIQAFHEIKTIVSSWIDKYGGKDKVKVREVGVFSHSGMDGPISYCTENTPPAANWPIQMAIPGGWNAIDFNWKEKDSICVFYGCNSGREEKEGFAPRISAQKNFQNVTVWGQSVSSFPSFEPDIRVTTPARAMDTGWNIGPTYMVGGSQGEGYEAIFGPPPKAKSMNRFMNGAKVGSDTQGVFNNHNSKNVD